MEAGDALADAAVECVGLAVVIVIADAQQRRSVQDAGEDLLGERREGADQFPRRIEAAELAALIALAHRFVRYRVEQKNQMGDFSARIIAEAIEAGAVALAKIVVSQH